MGVYVLRVVLLAGIVLTVVMVVNEAAGWRRMDSAVSSRQRLVRVACGITLVLLLGLILVDSILGILFTPGVRGIARRPVVALAYFSAYMGVACLLVTLALLDVRETLRTSRRLRREMREGLTGKDGQEQ